jgi:hypothetical protein
MGSFVLHGLLDAIGFVDWAMGRGDGWIFEAMHEHSDPSNYASQLLNRRLVAAGARGASIETVHSLRGDGIDGLRDAEIAARASQLQSGHSFGNLHDEYGHIGTGLAKTCLTPSTRPGKGGGQHPLRAGMRCGAGLD